MANSYTFPVVYRNMLDAIFQKESITADWTAADGMYRFSAEDAATVYLKTIALQGLGDYTRDTGYDAGDVTVGWTAYTMGQDRSKRFIMDSLDIREAYTDILQVGAEFTRTKVIPEIDAYRFAKAFSLCSSDVAATLTADTVMAAIRTGIKTLNDAEIPAENRVLYVSSNVMQLMEDSGEFFKTINTQSNNGIVNTQIMSFNGMQVREVPNGRFNTAITLNASGAGGFTQTGYDINFMIVYRPSVMAVVKHIAPKIISADLNQSADGWIYAYRIYHELFVPTNKLPGVYIHNKAS
jgi:hypothetical protein